MTTNIVDLFASGEEGVWFSPRDKTKMWTDSTRATPVTTDGDPVGEQWSQGLGVQIWADQVASITNSTSGASGVYVAETNTMTNELVGTSNLYPIFSFDLSLTATKRYEVRAQLSGDIGLIDRVRLHTTGGANNLNYDPSTGIVDGATVAGAQYLQFLTDGRNLFSITIESISVLPISDVVRTASAPDRPVYKEDTYGHAYLDYAGSKTFTYSSSQAGLKWLHDGTGGTLVAWLGWASNTDTDLYVSSVVYGTHSGVRVGKASGVPRSKYQVYRAVSGQILGTVYLDKAMSGSPTMHRFSYEDTGTTNDLLGYKDSCRDVLDNAQQSYAPSTANATNDLATHSSYSSTEYDTVLISRVLSQAESQDVYDYLKGDILADVPSTGIDLGFTLIGQSNQVTNHTLDGVVLETPQDGVYCYTKSEEYKIASIPEHDFTNVPVLTSPTNGITSPGQGLSLRMAKYLNTTYSKTSLLVPCAVGGTTIAEWDHPESVGDRTSLFGAMAYRHDLTRSRYDTPVVVVFGHEGSRSLAYDELDYVNGGVGTVYTSQMATYLGHVRDVVGASTPIVMVQLAGEDNQTLAEHNAAAGEAIRQVAATTDNTYLVVAHDVERDPAPNQIHVSAVGMTTVADRVALAVAQHVLGESVNGTGPTVVSTTKTGTNEVTVRCSRAVNTTPGDYGDLFRVYSADGTELTVTSANRGGDTSTVVVTCSTEVVQPATISYGYKAAPANAARTDFVQDSDGVPLAVFGPLAITNPSVVGSERMLLLGVG